MAINQQDLLEKRAAVLAELKQDAESIDTLRRLVDVFNSRRNKLVVLDELLLDAGFVGQLEPYLEQPGTLQFAQSGPRVSGNRQR